MVDRRAADENLDQLPTDQELGRLQWTTVLDHLHETNPDNGLVRDKADPAAPCSIAAVGLALAMIPALEASRARRAHSQVRCEERPPTAPQPHESPAGAGRTR